MKILSIGYDSENMACNYLQGHSLKLVEKNYCCRSGEIDLIMQDKDQLVFVEVCYRKCENFGTAIETVDQKKIKKLISTTQHYLARNKLDVSARFDVVGFDASLKPNWISNAFSEF